VVASLVVADLLLFGDTAADQHCLEASPLLFGGLDAGFEVGFLIAEDVVVEVGHGLDDSDAWGVFVVDERKLGDGTIILCMIPIDLNLRWYVSSYIGNIVVAATSLIRQVTPSIWMHLAGER
jgi:hypothetical protein